jgi:hypothetical protein
MHNSSVGMNNTAPQQSVVRDRQLLHSFLLLDVVQ